MLKTNSFVKIYIFIYIDMYLFSMMKFLSALIYGSPCPVLEQELHADEKRVRRETQNRGAYIRR